MLQWQTLLILFDNVVSKQTLRIVQKLIFIFCINFACILQVGAQQFVQPDPALRQLLIKAIKSSDSFLDRFEAEVWLVDMSQRLQPFIKDEQTRLDLLRRVHREATRVELAPELVLALIEIESRFDPYAISRSGAQGLMQVMPFWLDEIGHAGDNLIKISTNLRMGCTILKYYMDMENNTLHPAPPRPM